MVILTSGTVGGPAERFCWQTQQDYAARIGAEWLNLPLTHGYQCHDVGFEALATLPAETRCLLLEWDVQVMPDAPNIFDALDFARFHLRRAPTPGYFNLGVMAGLPHHFARLLEIKRPTRPRDSSGMWEYYLNHSMARHGFEVTPLAPAWNSIGHPGHFVHHLTGLPPADPTPPLGEPPAA